ncbi:MAG TPA: hypothetical protein VEB41_03395 [Burkholderiales bacterium]|nr:hypothetical protein [Burkholderiales bacterium]
MSWKKTDLERLKAASLTDRVTKSSAPERYGKGSAIVSRKEQRELERAQGLVPFAVKLKGELVKRLQDKAQAEGRPLNEVAGELLEKALR